MRQQVTIRKRKDGTKPHMPSCTPDEPASCCDEVKCTLWSDSELAHKYQRGKVDTDQTGLRRFA